MINPEDLLNQEWSPISKKVSGPDKNNRKRNKLIDYYRHHKKRRKYDNNLKKIYSENLDDPYIKNLLLAQGINNPDQQMIELKRANMMLKREMKKQIQHKKNVEKKLQKKMPKQLTFDFYEKITKEYKKLLK
jgi:hypothetical protein